MNDGWPGVLGAVQTAFSGAGIDLITACLLVAVSFVTSAISVTFSIGGGIAMLIVLLNLVPPIIALPVHALIQFGSNAGRAMIMRQHIMPNVALWFSIGGLVGVGLAGAVFFALPTSLLQIMLALFILWSVWSPAWRAQPIAEKLYLGVGAGVGFSGMFLGATGPMLAAFISPDRYGRDRTVATHATCMSFVHVLKVIAFGMLGFALLPWLGVIALMIFSGFMGTLLGRRLLSRIPERQFRMAFKVMLSLLAVRLLWNAMP